MRQSLSIVAIVSETGSFLLPTAPNKAVASTLRLLLRPVPEQRGVLIVTRSDLFPADHGAAVKIDRTAWGLSLVAGPVYVVTDDRRHYYRYIDGRREPVHYPSLLANVGPWRRMIQLALQRAGVPPQDAFLYYALKDWNLLLRGISVAARHGIRIFQAEFPAYALVCLWAKLVLGGRTVLVEHNIEFERLRDQVPVLSPEGYIFLRDAEIGLCNRVDVVVAVSQRDRNMLVDAGVGPERIDVIPHGVDIPAFDAAALPTEVLQRLGIAPGRPILVYHGTYLYPPNLEAIQVLGNEILPRLSAKGLRPAVLAVGPNPPDQTVHPDIIFVGSVDSVAPYLKAADVAVVPLQQGGGTRMKVLDYFAAEVPVVSTSKGVEGLELTDGDQLLIRDGYDAFAQAVASLLKDKVRARALGAAGRNFVLQFDWLNIARCYLELYEAEGRSKGVVGGGKSGQSGSSV